MTPIENPTTEDLELKLKEAADLLELATNEFWNWEDEGPHGMGWRSDENAECYERIRKFLLSLGR